jgi:uncharacterized protein YggE
MKDNSMQMLIPMQMLILVLVIAILIVQIIALFESASYKSVTYPPTTVSRYITISATGTASAVPTQGIIYVSAQGRGKTGAAATANLSIALSQMNSSIFRYINGNYSFITTTYYELYNQTNNIYPVGVAGTGSVNGSGAMPSIYPYYFSYNGFVATEQLNIIIPNTKNISKAIGALSAINGITVSSASATLSNSQITSLRNAAYASAISNATSQAEILTGNAQLSTQNITVGYYNYYPIAYGVASSSGINSTTPVNPQFYSGTSSITEQINIVFSYSKQ